MGNVFLLSNIYAPNNYQQQVKFWSDLRHIWENVEDLHESTLITGGDFNVVMDPKVDRISISVNTPYSHVSRDNLVMLLNDFNLCDIWRFFSTLKRNNTLGEKEIVLDCQDNVFKYNICSFNCN